MSATPKPSTPSSHFTRSFSAILRSPMTVIRSHSLKRSRSASLPPSSHNPLPPVILQTYSVSTDSIVLTALPVAPFCCHEDLLTMPRIQLEAVVRALNERLPRRLRIGTREEGDAEEADSIQWISETELRKRIEELVGIRPVIGTMTDRRSQSTSTSRLDAPPPAPKPTRTRSAVWKVPETAPWDMDSVDCDRMEDGETGFLDVTQSSPLAMRERTCSMSRRRSNTLSRLDILTEENEGEAQTNSDGYDEDASPRALKRRRVSSDDDDDGDKNVDRALPASARETTSHFTVPTPQGSRFLENMDASGSPSMVTDDNTSVAELTTTIDSQTDESHNLDVSRENNHTAPRTVLPRRRSARIHQRALQRTSSANARSTNLDQDTNSRAKSDTHTARTRQTPPTSETNVNVNKPRECTIRLPFTSTPPAAAATGATQARTSSPRVLRSHSRRSTGTASNAEEPEGSVLVRSRSERLPQVETAFVTIHRPRYRFGRRKSKRGKHEKENDDGIRMGGACIR